MGFAPCTTVASLMGTFRAGIRRGLLGASALLACAGCATPAPSGSKEVAFVSGRPAGGKVTEAQLQDGLFRFTNRFFALAQEGLSDLEASPDASLRDRALQRRLLYDSVAVDISIGQSPQAALLDMVTFVELSRDAWNDYWFPRVFGAAGEPMSRQFEQASFEAWSLAESVLDEQGMAMLADVIRQWRLDHPGQVSVETVRLSQFAEETGARAERMRSEVGGLLASVQGATLVGDRALLFSERALFYAQRAPFLWRLQAKLGTRDVLTEALTTLASARELVAEGPRLHQVLGDLDAMLARVTDVLVKSAERPETLRMSMALLDRLSGVLREWREVLVATPLPDGRARTVGETVEASANRILWKGFLYGAALVVLCGAVAFGARVASRWLVLRLEARRKKNASSREDRKAA